MINHTITIFEYCVSVKTNIMKERNKKHYSIDSLGLLKGTVSSSVLKKIVNTLFKAHLDFTQFDIASTAAKICI